jgi:type IV pilus assembly protein PilA
MPFSVRLTRERAFTLIELLIVILIIGVLVAIAAPSFLGQVQKAQNSSVQQQLAVTRIELKSIWTDNNQTYCPADIVAATTGATIDGIVKNNDPENDCTQSVINALKASEPQYTFAPAAGGSDAVYVNTISVTLEPTDNLGDTPAYTDGNAEVAQACEESSSNVVFCFQVNELAQDVALNGESVDTPTFTDEIYGAADVTNDGTSGDAVDAMEWGHTEADGVTSCVDDTLPPCVYSFISNTGAETTNNWADAPEDAAPATAAIPGNAYSEAVLNGGVAPTPWLYWRLQEDPTASSGNAADSAGGHTGDFSDTVSGDNGATTSGPTDEYLYSATAPGTISGEKGWALQGPYDFSTEPNSSGDAILYETNGDIGPAYPTTSWTLEGWVQMPTSGAANSETDILGAEDQSQSDESVAITADANGVAGQLGFYTGEYCDDASNPGDGGEDGGGNPLCQDGSTPVAGTETTVGSPYTDGHWHYVVATYDGTTIDFYVDGSLVRTIPYVSGLSPVNDLSGGIFANDPVPTGAYDPTGISESELAVYTSALTSAQVMAHFTAAG